MPHVEELSGPLQTALTRMDVAEIKPKVTFLGRSLVQTGTNAGGFPVFGTTYQSVSVDISNRVSDTDPIRINMEKPIFPNSSDDRLISSSGVALPLINTDTRMSCTQSGSIIDPDSIENGAVIIQGRIGSLSTVLNMFTGRITGLPSEKVNKSTLEVIDSLFDSITTELRYENFGQNAYVLSGNLVTDGVEINQGIGSLKFHDGYLTYDEQGNLITTFENNKPEIIDLLDIYIKSGARLGVYTIEFLASGGFRVSFPDSTFMQGDTATVFDSPAITIHPSFWQIAQGQTNFNGTKITFQLNYNVEGNPFSIIKNFIEKSYLKNWGDTPSDTSQISYAGLTLPVLWASLDELERRFRLIKVYVSVGNKNNEVFEKKPGGKPINCISVAQQVADHCFTSILIDNSGEMRAQGPQIFDTPIYDLTDTHLITFELIGQSKDNFLTANYGQNGSSGAYGKKIEHDLRNFTDTPIQEVTINFPFYKIGVSDNHAAYFARLFKERIKLAHVRARATVIPQFGISLIPGDRIRIVTGKQPSVTHYFEIYSASKTINFDPVDIEMAKIQTPEGVELSPCIYSFCADGLCA